MTGATQSLLILTLGMMGILLILSIIGEFVRARVAGGDESPTAEIYMTRVQSWWAMVLLLSLALIAGHGEWRNPVGEISRSRLVSKR